MDTWLIEGLDPYKNTSLETALFKKNIGPKVLLWQNSPSLFIGRNQSPWHEVDLQQAFAGSVPIIRRHSGGGTVYHDPGNLNISFFDGASKGAHFDTLLKTFSLLGVPARVGERGEITVQGYKISGTAFYYFQGRMLHHLTMLFEADINRLWQYLKADEGGVASNDSSFSSVSSNSTASHSTVSKAVASVRQPVANLCALYPHLTISDFVDAFDLINGTKSVAKTLNQHIEVLKVDEKDLVMSILGDVEKQLKSWEWTFGNTPEFSSHFDFMGTRLKLVVRNGRVFGIEGSLDSAVGDLLKERLQKPFMIEDWQSNKRYDAN